NGKPCDGPPVGPPPANGAACGSDSCAPGRGGWAAPTGRAWTRGGRFSTAARERESGESEGSGNSACTTGRPDCASVRRCPAARPGTRGDTTGRDSATGFGGAPARRSEEVRGSPRTMEWTGGGSVSVNGSSDGAAASTLLGRTTIRPGAADD